MVEVIPVTRRAGGLTPLLREAFFLPQPPPTPTCPRPAFTTYHHYLPAAFHHLPPCTGCQLPCLFYYPAAPFLACLSTTFPSPSLFDSSGRLDCVFYLLQPACSWVDGIYRLFCWVVGGGGAWAGKEDCLNFLLRVLVACLPIQGSSFLSPSVPALSRHVSWAEELSHAHAHALPLLLPPSSISHFAHGGWKME